MAEDTLGFAATSQGTQVQVLTRHNGGAVIVDLRTLSEIRLDAAQLDELRELLDRAAMPGQPAMCQAHEDDCPNGPEPHPFVPDNELVLPCCRQPWETTD